MVNPRYLHLLETEDGQPRTLDVNGHTVGIAVCRALLTGIALDIDTAVLARVLMCGSCRAVAADLDWLRNQTEPAGNGRRTGKVTWTVARQASEVASCGQSS